MNRCVWPVLAAISLYGCALAGSPSAPPSPPPTETEAPKGGEPEVGLASWYGPTFHGRPTASGETYDMDAATAAHRTLPFGTRVRIENLDNGRVTTVTINDRGPFVGDRILDVSRRAARDLGMIGPGTARVRITVVEAPSPIGCWMVQLGAFSSQANARSRRDQLASQGLDVRVVASPDGLYRVQAGPYSEQEVARSVAAERGGILIGC